jgi:hypothetical protein
MIAVSTTGLSLAGGPRPNFRIDAVPPKASFEDIAPSTDNRTALPFLPHMSKALAALLVREVVERHNFSRQRQRLRHAADASRGGANNANDDVNNETAGTTSDVTLPSAIHHSNDRHAGLASNTIFSNGVVGGAPGAAPGDILRDAARAKLRDLASQRMGMIIAGDTLGVAAVEAAASVIESTLESTDQRSGVRPAWRGTGEGGNAAVNLSAMRRGEAFSSFGTGAASAPPAALKRHQQQQQYRHSVRPSSSTSAAPPRPGTALGLSPVPTSSSSKGSLLLPAIAASRGASHVAVADGSAANEVEVGNRSSAGCVAPSASRPRWLTGGLLR